MPEVLQSSRGSIPQRAPVKRESRRLLRLKEAATYLHLSPDTLRRIIWAGELEVVQYGSNTPFLLDIHDLDDWIQAHKKRF